MDLRRCHSVLYAVTHRDMTHKNSCATVTVPRKLALSARNNQCNFEQAASRIASLWSGQWHEASTSRAGEELRSGELCPLSLELAAAE